jgi:hypothetical protein
MNVKRLLTLIFGLVLVSIAAKYLVLQMNPPFRLYKVAYEYNYSPTNYIQFFILFFIPSVSAIFLYRVDFIVINSFYDRIARTTKNIFLAAIKNKEVVLVGAIALFWVFNLMQNAFFKNLIESKNPFDFPFDTYHEGEKIGFLYTFLKNGEALKEMVIIHGYFLEVLTSYLAYLVTPENHAVMGFRFLFTFQTLLAWLGVIWVIWEIVNFTTKKENKFFLRAQFILFSVVFVASNESFLALDYQQGLLFFQLGLVFYLLRNLATSSSLKLILITSFVIGMSVPLGPLYSMKYGLIFGVVFFIIIFLLSFYEKYKLFLFGSFSGIAFSTAIIFLTLGLGQILELCRMVAWVVKFYSLRFSAPLLSDANEHYLWIPQLVIGILIICGIQLIALFKQSKNIQSFVRENTHLIVLLSLSVLALKIGLDLSDKRHFRSMANPSLLLLFLSSAIWMDRLNEIRGPILELCKTYKTACFYILIFLLFINAHPKEAFRHIKPYWKYISTTDDDLLAKVGYGYILAVKEMRPEIADMECFYTLTSENIWYYYFKKPSCSKHHVFGWAMTKKSRYEIIDSLRSKQPEIILFSNYRSNKSFKASHLNPEVYDFIYQNYRPYKLVENHWFWKRFPGGVSGGQITKLDIILNMTRPKYDSYEAFITIYGILHLKKINKIDAVYVAKTDSKNPLAITVNDGNMIRVKSDSLEIPWSLKIPMINILPETKSYQLWGYSIASNERVKIGEKFKLDYTKVNIKNN